MKRTAVQDSLVLALLAALFFIPFLGGVHLFDWDEINFAEISREMIETGDYFRVYVNYQPFWEKPPFFFWLQAGAMHSFGINEFSARLPNAISGILTLVILYHIGLKLYNRKFGLMWALTYFGSVLPFLYFKSGIIDPWFNLFIFLGVYLFVLGYWKKDGFSIHIRQNYWLLLLFGGLVIGMGILTKGPVAYLIAGLTFAVYWVYQRFRFYINVPEFALFTLGATLATLIWFGIETASNGPWFINEFTRYQYRLFSTPDAGHKGFPGYHFAVLLVGCFPASVFAIRAFFKRPGLGEKDFQLDFRLWMKFLFWVVLILFTIVQSKIVHYSSMCYFPLTYLAAEVLFEITEGRLKFNNWMRRGLIAIGSLFILVILAMPWLGMQPELLKPLFDDPFAVGNLDAEVNWTGWEILPGLLLLAILSISISLFNRNRAWKGFLVLFLGGGLFVFLTLVFFIKRVEGYSQRAAIEFFSKRAGEDCYLGTRGYKSYAHLFYGKTQPGQNPNRLDLDWLLEGPIDKPVYFSTRIHQAEKVESFPGFERLYQKNGFVFFKRNPIDQ